MEIKYWFVLGIGAAVIVGMIVLLVLQHRKDAAYTGGKKVARLSCGAADEYFRKKLILYRILTGLVIVCFVMIVGSAFWMMSKPYETERVQDEKYCRDIILCIDISTSVDYLNENLLEKLKSMVDELNGERFGIVLFNTSPVMLTPLTDDYDYVKQQLDIIQKSLKVRNSYDIDYWNIDDMEWLYYEAYISSGTLVGNEERGSSLIGDGLAAAAYDFSDKEEDKDRTKVIIFSTDNDIQGEPIATLDEAATICRNNNITVYGVGTKEMTSENMESMKSAVEKTGGSFFLEEESGSFGHIVDSINKLSKSLVKVRTFTKEIPRIEIPFVLMLISFGLMLSVTKILKI